MAQPFAFLETFVNITYIPLDTHIPCLTRVWNNLLTSYPDFVLDLARNGELQSRISRMGSLSTTCARYYAAQLIDALDYMHLRGVIHRYTPFRAPSFPPADRVASDLKPENLLLDDDFRIKVTDFGTGKLIDVPRSFSLARWLSENPSLFDPAERATKTFVGTAQYVSPELLEANETSKRCAPTRSGTCKPCLVVVFRLARTYGPLDVCCIK